MINFLIKGLIRDRHRSLFPVITVSAGVMLTVLLHCWLTGIMGDLVDYNARFVTGHVKIMSRAYSEIMDQIPNDLALVETGPLMENLKEEYPEVDWVRRIRFGGLVDAPDENGETKEQGPAIGLAIDLLSENSTEIKRLNVDQAIVRGKMPENPGEILISNEFANKLDIKPGDPVTLISSTMYGSMAMYNYTVSGMVEFGISVMDRGAIIVDIKDAQIALDMVDASSEILGYFNHNMYNDAKALKLSGKFNGKHEDKDNEFSPVMLRLTEMNGLASMIDYANQMSGIFVAVFVSAMSIVLWNAGLLGGLRRYGEMGTRLAIGEDKGHVYRSMIVESVLIGLFGSVIGTAIGLAIAYFLQTVGVDIGSMMKNATIMMPTTFRANITPPAYYIGFIPGLLSTLLGTMLSGIGIYKRKTAQLFKELEV